MTKLLADVAKMPHWAQLQFFRSDAGLLLALKETPKLDHVIVDYPQRFTRDNLPTLIHLSGVRPDNRGHLNRAEHVLIRHFWEAYGADQIRNHRKRAELARRIAVEVGSLTGCPVRDYRSITRNGPKPMPPLMDYHAMAHDDSPETPAKRSLQLILDLPWADRPIEFWSLAELLLIPIG